MTSRFTTITSSRVRCAPSSGSTTNGASGDSPRITQAAGVAPVVRGRVDSTRADQTLGITQPSRGAPPHSLGVDVE